MNWLFLFIVILAKSWIFIAFFYEIPFILNFPPGCNSKSQDFFWQHTFRNISPEILMKFHYYRWQRVQNIVCLPPIMMQFQKLKHYVILKCYIFFSIFQVDCPFIVCMTYAFHTPDKLCFILDLMNGEYLIIFWLEYFIVYRWDSP